MTDDSTPPPSSPPSDPGPSGGAGGTGPGPGTGRRPPAGSGLEENVAGALSYLLGPVTGVIFLIVDKERPFVRFHAVQCLVVTIAWLIVSFALMVAGTILGMIPVVGFIVTTLAYFALSIVGFILWLVLMYRAFQGEEWEVPVLGEYARRYESRV